MLRMVIFEMLTNKGIFYSFPKDADEVLFSALNSGFHVLYCDTVEKTLPFEVINQLHEREAKNEKAKDNIN